MTIIETSNLNNYLRKTPHYQGNFQTQGINQKSKVATYLDSLYSYPPKIKIKWNTLDKFTNQSDNGEKTTKNSPNLPFVEFIEDWFINDTPQQQINENYKLTDYLDGYVDKTNSTNFYKKGTKELQQALSKVPVYFILNGNGEIILNKPTKDLGPKTFPTVLNEELYDICGAFDTTIEKQQQFGMFFMSRIDAETYLKAVAQSDLDGTQTVGLAIQCVGLDSAYRITREHHPGIDFRFVPDLQEVQNLLSRYLTNSDLVLDVEQQQVTKQAKTANVLPIAEKVGLRVSQILGTRSFAQNNEFFKGVPIYIVQLTNQPRNIVSTQYFKIMGTLDTGVSRITRLLLKSVGLGDKVLLQGQLDDTNVGNNVINYIFFDKAQATTFVKQNKEHIAHYPSAHLDQLSSIIQKPTIFLSNLEDFLESWEDNKLLKGNESRPTIYDNKETVFVSPKHKINEVLDFKQQNNEPKVKNIIKGLTLKIRVLKRNIGIFASVD